jgi:hypothetical protein
MDTDKDFIDNLTAETQSTQRQEFLPNPETTIGQNLLASMEMNKSSIYDNQRKSAVKYPLMNLTIETCFCLSSAPDKQKTKSLRPLRLCGE